MTDDARIRELILINPFAVFNQRDPERRLKAITVNYTEDVIWTDPERTFRGHEELNERAQGAARQDARFRIHRRGAGFHVLRDLGHQPFNHGAPEQPPAISGYDVVLVPNGRIAALYTLLNT